MWEDIKTFLMLIVAAFIGCYGATLAAVGTFRYMRLFGYLTLLVMLSGCAKQFLGSTEASYGDYSYSSTKNQENLKASFTKDKDGMTTFTIETTATTPEAAIAAAAQAYARSIEMLTGVIDKLTAGAKAGALSGS